MSKFQQYTIIFINNNKFTYKKENEKYFRLFFA